MTLSPTQLIIIRDQLVKSLARVRELEKQVQLVPSLHQTIHDLTEQLAEQTRVNQELQNRLAQRTKSVADDHVEWTNRSSQTVMDVNSAEQGHEGFRMKSFTWPKCEKKTHTPFIDSCVQAGNKHTSSQSMQTCMECGEFEMAHFLGHLQEFVEQNDLMNDALFDADRYADLIYCFQANRWHELLIMSNVISLGLMPLPEPPSITELDLTIRPPSTDAVIQTEMYDVWLRNWKSLENRCYELMCKVDHQRTREIPKVDNQTPVICIPDWSHICSSVEDLSHLVYSHCYQIKQTELQMWNCVEWCSVSEESVVLSNGFLIHLFSHASLVDCHDANRETTSTVVQRKNKIIKLVSHHQEGFVNHGHRFTESKHYDCQVNTRNDHVGAAVPLPALFNRIFEIDVENLQGKKIQNSDREFTKEHLLVHSGCGNDSFDPIRNEVHYPFNNTVNQIDQNVKKVCFYAPPCLIEQTSTVLYTSQMMEDIQSVTLKADVVEQPRSEHDSLIPRRLLWYFSVSLRQSRSKDLPHHDRASVNGRKFTHLPCPRFSFFNALNWKRAREGQKSQEPIASKAGNESVGKTNVDSVTTDSGHVPVYDSDNDDLHIVQAIPNRETCLPIATSLHLKDSTTKVENCKLGMISPMSQLPCRTSHLPVQVPMMNTQTPSKYASPFKSSQVLKFKEKVLLKTSNTVYDESVEHEKDEAKTVEPIRSLSSAENKSRLRKSCSKSLDFESFKNSSTGPTESATGLVAPSFLAACRTFAAWLEDSTNISCKALNNATEIVRRNWFEVTSDPQVTEQRVKAYIKALQGFPSCSVDRVVNMTDENCNTALHYAVSRARWNVVGLLLSRCPGINVNAFNRAGYTPPMLAAVIADQPRNPAELGALEQMFLRADLSLCSANAQKQSVLMLAAIHGRISLVHRLITMHKAPINQKDAEGSTALMAAAEHNRSNVVRLLLSHPDVDATLRDNDGCTALDIALAKRHHDIALMIYAKAKIQKMRLERSHATLLPRFRTSENSKLPLLGHRKP